MAVGVLSRGVLLPGWGGRGAAGRLRLLFGWVSGRGAAGWLPVLVWSGRLVEGRLPALVCLQARGRGAVAALWRARVLHTPLT